MNRAGKPMRRQATDQTARIARFERLDDNGAGRLDSRLPNRLAAGAAR